jgi:hypothetical protein
MIVDHLRNDREECKKYCCRGQSNAQMYSCDALDVHLKPRSNP